MKEKDPEPTEELLEGKEKDDHPENDLKEPNNPSQDSQENFHKEKDLKEPPPLESPPKINIKKYFYTIFFILKIIFNFYLIYLSINLLINKDFNSQYQYKLKLSLIKLRKIIDEKFPGLLANPVIFNIIDYDILVVKAKEIVLGICLALILGSVMNLMKIKFAKIILFIAIILDIGLVRTNDCFIRKNKNINLKNINVLEAVKFVCMIFGIFL